MPVEPQVRITENRVLMYPPGFHRRRQIAYWGSAFFTAVMIVGFFALLWYAVSHP